MKIIGGTHRGRIIIAPDTTATRPISSRVREALFNILGDISDLTWLDVYAGSGAVSFEALSRGVSHVDAVDAAAIAVSTINQNAVALKFHDKITIHHQTIEGWLRDSQVKFDVIFAGPPFPAIDERVLARLVSHLKPNGTFIINHPRRMQPLEFSNLTLRRSRRYGISSLSVYK